MQIIQEVKKEILDRSIRTKEKSDEFGEVFTPYHLISDMLDLVKEEDWSNPETTFYDPCAGKGNFPILIIERLFKGLEGVILNEQERLEHIVGKQLFMTEYQESSYNETKELFSRFGVELNFKLGNALEIFGQEFGVEGFTYTIANPPYQSAETRRRIFNKFIEHTNTFSDKQIYIIPNSWIYNKYLKAKLILSNLVEVKFYPRDIFPGISLRYGVTIVGIRTKPQKNIDITVRESNYSISPTDQIFEAEEEVITSIKGLLEYPVVPFTRDNLPIPRKYRTEFTQESLPEEYSQTETETHKYKTRMYLTRHKFDIFCSIEDLESYNKYSVCFGLVNGMGSIAGVYILEPGLQPCGNIYSKSFDTLEEAEALQNYLTSDFHRNIIKHTKTNDVLNGPNNVLKFITYAYQTN